MAPPAVDLLDALGNRSITTTPCALIPGLKGENADMKVSGIATSGSTASFRGWATHVHDAVTEGKEYGGFQRFGKKIG